MYDPDKECKEMIETVKRLCEQKNITPCTGKTSRYFDVHNKLSGKWKNEATGLYCSVALQCVGSTDQRLV
mgnify:CR=1 FL=1